MKKIFIFILILGILFALTGCSKRAVIDNGQTFEIEANFYIIKTLYHCNTGYDVRLCYDPETKVMYYMIGNCGSYSFCISPYYLPNGVVGIYGKNYH